ncbi:cytosolic phospholipase A2 gamma-like isoform X2 [Pleurodeles waltl]|uniref:cytosolic phospholipase A2 gamma-like isoform X2 n=1 Tax=Pleurodeles waltl TaxID=8319 RepID=UPI0037094C28
MHFVTSGWISVLAFLWLQSNQTRSQNVGTTGNSTYVHFTNDISDGEKKSTCERAKVVSEWYKRQGITIAPEEVPTIVFLGSGGGLTAALAILATLEEMKTQGLLDGFMYIFGCSGSTWGMTVLYDKGDWVSKLETLNEDFCNRIANPFFDAANALVKLIEASKHEDYSMTDVWCATTINMSLKEYNEHTMSSWSPIVENGSVPYPSFSAVDIMRLRNSTFTDPDIYFENTVPWSGYSPNGPFVTTSYFRSSFEDGDLVKREDEPNLCYLQALWGSVFANKPEAIANALGAFALVIIDPNGNIAAPLADMSLLPDGTALDPLLAKLNSILYLEGDELNSTLQDILNTTPGNEDKASYNVTKMITSNWFTFDNATKQIAVTLLSTLLTLESIPPIGLTDAGIMFLKTMKSVAAWEWGTTNNFAKRKDSTDPSKIYLMDAGDGMRTPYPQALQTARGVAMIVDLEVATENTFSTLERAAKYCSENNIPFPFKGIPPGEGSIANYSCYIFEEQSIGTVGVPILIHMPLFNKQNDKGENTAIKYTYFRTQYTKPETVSLQSYAKENVVNCAEQIKQKMIQLVQQNSFIKRAGCPVV